MSIDVQLTAESSIQKILRPVSDIPKVSIGMPVYNGEPFIREALDSLFAQTFINFELIISDNASTDRTEEICREYAERDTRIRYIRQMENIGASANFQFVLGQANGKYFMWAAADDIRSASFLEFNLKFLENNHGYISSTSPVRFQNGDLDPVKMGYFALDHEDPCVRIYNFFTEWHANGRFYSLILRSALQELPYFKLDILGADWLWVIHLASNGKMANISEGYVILGNFGASNSINVFKKYNKNCILFLIPFYSLSKITFSYFNNASFILKVKLLAKFSILNFRALILNVGWILFDKRS
jgi:glycosyltransferase involved in cell wall biosynthesis